MPLSQRQDSAEPTLYEILSLTPKHLEGQTSTAQAKVVKKAYHRALLQNHPDKAKTNSNDGATSGVKTTEHSHATSSVAVYTVDQIQEAFTTLSDSKKRTEYNRSLHVSTRQQRNNQTKASFSFQTGLEIVDLDDVEFDERRQVYYRSCRCGNPRGYCFTEDNLEEFEDDGVLMVECLDCSLWLRVLFAPAVDDDGGVDGNAIATASSVASRGGQDGAEISRPGSNTTNGALNGQAQTKNGLKLSWSVSWGVSLNASASASSSRD